MKVVVDIPNWLYNAIMKHKEPVYSQSLGEAVRDGTPLPKRYRDLYDCNDLSKLVGEDFQFFLSRLDLKSPQPIIEADKR